MRYWFYFYSIQYFSFDKIFWFDTVNEARETWKRGSQLRFPAKTRSRDHANVLECCHRPGPRGCECSRMINTLSDWPIVEHSLRVSAPLFKMRATRISFRIAYTVLYPSLSTKGWYNRTFAAVSVLWTNWSNSRGPPRHWKRPFMETDKRKSGCQLEMEMKMKRVKQNCVIRNCTGEPCAHNLLIWTINLYVYCVEFQD